jgi:carboxyl-terminal processing protease
LTSAKYYTPSGRLIQRDYSNGGFYSYYTHGGVTGSDQNKETKQTGAEKKTDTGRAVYEGGGIAPDESVAARTINLTQRRLLSPTFAFARDLVNGRVKGFEGMKLTRGVDYKHELLQDEFKVSNGLYEAFRSFVLSDPLYKMTAAQLDRNRSFIETYIRFNITTAAYGRTIGDRVFIVQDDPQVAKAIEVVPKARDLAQGTRQSKAQ